MLGVERPACLGGIIGSGESGTGDEARNPLEMESWGCDELVDETVSLRAIRGEGGMERV
jgi:hypothetical protein